MQYLHNTDTQILLPNWDYNGKENDPFRLRDTLKPHGLWYSIDNEWVEWCEANAPSLIKTYTHEIEFEKTYILTLYNSADVLSFQNQYKKPAYGFTDNINWGVVKRDYKGIELQNYYDYRYNLAYGGSEYLWLYSWDVPSGCIWDASIIKQKEAVQLFLK